MARLGRALASALFCLLLLGQAFALQEYLMPCALPSDYASFWNYAHWRYDNRQVIPLLSGDIYSDRLHGAQSSLGAYAWQLEDLHTLQSAVPDEIGGSKTAADAQRKKIADALSRADSAKSAYADEVLVWGKVSDEVRSLGILATYKWLFGWYFNGDKLLPGVPWKLVVEYTVQYYDPLRPEFGLIRFSDYAKQWQKSARAQLDALSAFSEMANSGFSSAENEAEQLHLMGAGNPGFPHNAQEAYLNWTGFAGEISGACASPSPRILSGSNLANQYSFALISARALQQETQNPHEIPSFYAEYTENGVIGPTDLVALSAGYWNSTLFFGAWEMQKSLAGAKASALSAYSNESDAAKSELSSLEAAIAQIKRSNPEKFTDYESLMPPANEISNSRFAGSPLVQLEAISNAKAGADSDFAKSKSIFSARGQDYLSDALPLATSARKSAQEANAASRGLISYMEYILGIAKSAATSKVSELESRMRAAGTSTPNGLAAFQQANAALSSARSAIARAASEQSAGTQYSLYIEALRQADGGMSALSSNDDSIAQWHYSKELSEASSLLSSLKSSCPQTDSSEIERQVTWAQAEFSALPTSANADKAAILRGASVSARQMLSACFAPLSKRYTILEARMDALYNIDSSLPAGFERAFEQYILPGGGWNDAAYANIGKVNSLLSQYEQRADGSQEKALESAICANSALVFLPSGNARTNTPLLENATWHSNPIYPVEVQGAFGVRCKVDGDLSGFSLVSGPPYVRLVEGANNSLAVYFSGLPSYADIQLSVSSSQTKFAIAEKSSSASISPEGSFTFSSAGQLSSFARAPSLDIYVPAPSEISNPSLSISGRLLPGQMGEADGVSYARFTLSPALPGKEQYALRANGHAQISILNSSFSQESSEFSRTLEFSSLPYSGSLDAVLSDMACADSDSMRFSSDLGAIEQMGAKRAGSPSYRFKLSPAMPGAKITIWCRANDAAALLREKRDELSATAYAEGVNAAFPLLLQANASIENGKYSEATSILSKAENAISDARQRKAESQSFSDELSSAQEFLASISPRDGASEGKFATDMFKISNSLSSAMSEAKSQNSSGQAKNAISKVRAALFDAISASKDKAYAEYSRLSMQLDSISAPAMLSGLPVEKELADASSSLSDARAILASPSASDAVNAVLLASEKVALAQSAADSSANSAWDAAASQASAIKKSASSLSDLAESYSSSISRVRASFGMYSPLLEPKSAKELASQAASDATAAEKAAAAKRTLASLADANKKIASANASLQLASSRLEEGNAHLLSHAQAKYRLAQAAVLSLSDEKLKQTLLAELEAINSQLSQGNSAEAVVRSESIIAKISKPSAQSSAFPLELAALTLLLAGGLAYVFFLRKAPEKPDGEKKKLSNSQDA